MQQDNRLGLRVPASRLVLMLGVFAVPALGLTDGTAAARSATAEVPAVEAAVVGTPITAGSRAAVPAEATAAFDAGAWHAADLGNVDPSVLSLALHAASAAIERGDAEEPATLTVIDFSKPSTKKRMWVYDLRARALLFEEHVAHGRNSGHNMTTAFSNQPESHKSSLGLFRAAEGYIGKHGYSLRLDGLERGFNDRARERAIVIHGAEYVNAATATAQGRLGRSLGCPAVRPQIASDVIDAIKDGGLVFAYYPDVTWLAASSYLN